MPRTALDALQRRVKDFFRQQADQYGLNPAAIETRYILNWGGFVNASFIITNQDKIYHLKLANEEEAQESLQRWKFFNRRLTEHYHAPRLRDWVQIPHTPFA